jgi:hypothetical protein
MTLNWWKVAGGLCAAAGAAFSFWACWHLGHWLAR